MGTVTNANLSAATYDTAGRISTIKETEIGGTASQLLTVKYSTATTATGTTPGEFTGRAREITLTDGATVQTLARYSYDASGLLRSVANPAAGIDAASYAYDTSGRVSDVASPANGNWDLSFPAGSASPNVDPVGPARPAQNELVEGPAGNGTATAPPAADFRGGEISDPQSNPGYCSAATDWMWYLKPGCVAWSAHYGWHWPGWKQTPTKHWVLGIANDGCSTPGPNISEPGGFNFRAACDTHDYGYGLIGNTYKGYGYYLDRWKKSNVDNAYHTTMKTYSCKAYAWWRQGNCLSFAYGYYKAVGLKGNPINGANET